MCLVVHILTTERVTILDMGRTIIKRAEGMCPGFRQSRLWAQQMNTTMTTVRPFPQPASLWGRSFLLTNEGHSIQREALPENWIIVRVNPLSIEAIHRAHQQVVEEHPDGRDLPY